MLLNQVSAYCGDSQRGAATEKVECFADLGGDKLDPNNIYTCVTPAKCCQEEGKPSCCSEKAGSVAGFEQAQLWGTLAGLILVLAIVMWYCRHDGDCCGNKKGEQGCCCCKRKDGNNDPGDEIEEVKVPPADDKTDSPPVMEQFSDI
ncbi:hypothetical protein Hamer_G017749 [Homarus americanus]|uniref:Uncharacterized protein n=1 Tax=Homarus americanus TaxID=6706 RepID=A0A8J5JIV6_HOMAM|nr:hypothetical protein Hamer_G017749 [Homarus americanus]